MNVRASIALPNFFRRGWSHWLILIAALLLGLYLAGNASAEAYLPAFGGQGGGQFKAPCNAGEMLTGFELRAGDDIDAIRPVCVTATGPREISTPPLTTDSGLVGPPNRTFNPQQLAPGWYGGTGGSIQRLLCPDETPIVIGIDIGAEGMKTVTVNNIHLFCGLAIANQAPSDQPSNVFDAPKAMPSAGPLGLSVNYPQSTTGSERCPAGQVAVGMHGRVGVWLDAMGLICDAPRVPPPPKPGIALGRVQGAPSMPLQRMGDEPPICAQARDARMRHSPVAPALEAKCQEVGGSFKDRAVTQVPSGILARNAVAMSHVGTPAPPLDAPPANAPPPVQAPPPDSPRMPDNRGLPGETFTPPLFADGAGLWACANAAQAAKKAGVCNGAKAGKAFCRAKGYSGALQQHRDGSPAVTVAPARAGVPIRAANGDICDADNCTVVSELDCAP